MSRFGRHVRTVLGRVPLVGPAGRCLWRLFRTPDLVDGLARQHVETTEAVARTEDAVARTGDAVARTEDAVARTEEALAQLIEEAQRYRREAETFRNYVGQALGDLGNEVLHHRDDVGQALGDLGNEVLHHRREVEAVLSALRRPTLDIINELSTHVEPYQPLYDCPAGPSVNKRVCIDRARAIEKALDVPVADCRLLDLGCSLGYFPFYFAARGARARGIDSNPLNVALARHVGEYNGLSVVFEPAEVTPAFADAVEPGTCDVALVLSLLHHLIAAHGIAPVRRMLAELCRKVPLVFVELATRDEQVDCDWREALPEDPMDTFADCEGVEVTLLGHFRTHLSPTPRPLYRLRRKSVVVNGVRYPYDRATPFAYRGSPDHVGSKMFYFGPDAFIKRVQLGEDNVARENLRQALREIVNYDNIQEAFGGSHWLPVFRTWECNAREISTVFDRLDGETLAEAIDHGRSIDLPGLCRLLIQALADLRTMGLHHNDLRTWNVMLANDRLHLIDLGHAAFHELDPTVPALLQVLHDAQERTVTLNVGWPLEAKYLRRAEDFDPAVRPVVERLLEAENFDDFLRREKPMSSEV